MTDSDIAPRRGSDVRGSDSARKCRGRKAVAVLLVKHAASFPRGRGKIGSEERRLARSDP
jgi:hypothetical protein